MGRYCPHTTMGTWKEILAHREKALAKRHAREHERWSEHTRLLQPLKVGDRVYIQNLVGNHPWKWERTGVVVETRQFHQYVVCIDGSGRVTLRNTQHLRKFTPFHKSPDTVVKELTAPLPYSSPAESVNNSSKPCTSTPPTVQPHPAESTNNGSKPCISTPPTVQPHPAESTNNGSKPCISTPPTMQPQTMKIMTLLTHRLKHPLRRKPMTASVSHHPTPPDQLFRNCQGLLPHNVPGQSEQQPLGPRRCKQTNKHELLLMN